MLQVVHIKVSSRFKTACLIFVYTCSGIKVYKRNWLCKIRSCSAAFPASAAHAQVIPNSGGRNGNGHCVEIAELLVSIWGVNVVRGVKTASASTSVNTPSIHPSIHPSNRSMPALPSSLCEERDNERAHIEQVQGQTENLTRGNKWKLGNALNMTEGW